MELISVISAGKEIRDVLEKGKNQAVEEEKVLAERERRYLVVRHG